MCFLPACWRLSCSSHPGPSRGPGTWRPAVRLGTALAENLPQACSVSHSSLVKAQAKQKFLVARQKSHAVGIRGRRSNWQLGSGRTSCSGAVSFLPGNVFLLLLLRWGGHTQKAQSVVPLITLPTGFSPVSWLLRKQCTSPSQEMF